MDTRHMTNKIKSKCPECKCKTADVLAKITYGTKEVIVVKCTDKLHQYFLKIDGKNTEWKQFFKKK